MTFWFFLQHYNRTIFTSRMIYFQNDRCSNAALPHGGGSTSESSAQLNDEKKVYLLPVKSSAAPEW